MALLILASVLVERIRLSWLIPFTLATVLYAFVRSYFWGANTTRDRDLHGRTVIVTGAFTPTGLTLVRETASRGAQIIALTPTLSDPAVQSLVEVLRTTTRNELIYAEQCDLNSPASIKTFSAQFLKATGSGPDAEIPRIDAIVLAHEYSHLGVVRASRFVKDDEKHEREDTTRASFLLTTLLLPTLLLAPPDRDIRIVHVVNPFYAASVPSFSQVLSSSALPKGLSTWQAEGFRSLRAILFNRHLQRVLEALPSKDQPAVNLPEEGEAVLPKKRPGRSNIVAVAVSPGISRADTIAPYLRADQTSRHFRLVGLLMYFVLLPLLHLVTKPSTSAIQSILHVLFLPTIIKRLPEDTRKEEYVQGGWLYAGCAPVRLPANGEEELGSEAVGRAIWEGLEKSTEQWKKDEEERMKEEREQIKHLVQTAESQTTKADKGKAKQS